MGFPLGKPAKPRPPHQRRSAGNSEQGTRDDDENDDKGKQELHGATAEIRDQRKCSAGQRRAAEQRGHHPYAVAALAHAVDHERELLLPGRGHVEA